MAASRKRSPRLHRGYLAGAMGVCAFLALAAFAAGALSSSAQTAPAPQQDPSAPPAAQQDPSAPAAQQDPSAPAAQQDPSAPAAQQDPSAPAVRSTPTPAQPSAAATSATQSPTVNGDQPPAAAKMPRPLYHAMTPEQKRKQQVADQCADMLQLANDLKAQVEKSRKDELSVSVVRKATQLEQMAHRVRNETQLAAGAQ